MTYLRFGLGQFCTKKALSLIAGMVLMPLCLVGCGGESKVYALETQDSEQAEPRSEKPVLTSAEAARARAQAVFLQSAVWTTGCENSQITTLDFSPTLLRTETVYYKDANCVEVRQEIQRVVLERYTVGADIVDTSGVIATQIHFNTVLSDRFELFVYENGALYFGQRNGQVSYSATSIDFQVPFFP